MTIFLVTWFYKKKFQGSFYVLKAIIFALLYLFILLIFCSDDSTWGFIQTLEVLQLCPAENKQNLYLWSSEISPSKLWHIYPTEMQQMSFMHSLTSNSQLNKHLLQSLSSGKT